MKQTVKRISFLLLAVLFALACGSGLAACNGDGEKTPPADRSSVHMYLIGGQSNAVGVSEIDSAVDEDMTKTFEGFAYYGETDKYCQRDGHSQSAQDAFIQTPVSPVRAGLGRNTNKIGPEYGMADALAKYYPDAADPNGRRVVIFKSCAGGVALRNSDGNNSQNYGNWYPPSLRGQLPESEVYAWTGKQYDRFIENFKIVYQQLIDMGEDVRIMGMAWMQGESDKDATDEYKEILPVLISDLRSDLSEITGQDLSDMLFVAGEISDTQGSGAASADEESRAAAVAKNKAFNAMLNGIVGENLVENFKVIPSGALPQHLADGTCLHVDHKTNLRVDCDHWAADEEVALGRMFGEALYAQ